MPKEARGPKYYAVRIGREGPKIYESWSEAKPNVLRFSGASVKSFPRRSQAEAWIRPMLGPNSSYDPRLDETTKITNSSTPRVEADPPSVLALPRLPSTRDREMFQDDLASPAGSDESALSVILEGIDSEPMENHGEPQVQPPSGQQADPLATESRVQLSQEQQEILHMVRGGRSVFFTGAAGSGKSMLLREIIRWCRDISGKKVAVTASTGIASINVGGSTLHSWAGIGLGKENAEGLLAKIYGLDQQAWSKRKRQRQEMGQSRDPEFGENNSTVKRWRTVKVLIVDEISMIDGVLFDKLEFLAREIRDCDAPFGGIQLVLCGDFCQLPPVWNKNTSPMIPPALAFEAKSWNDCMGKPIALQRVFRQEEQSFVNMLNCMRFGFLSTNIIKTFKALSREVHYDDGVGPTELFPTRNEVNTANFTKLKKLSGDPHSYDARDMRGFNENGTRISVEIMNKLLNDLVAQRKVTLKVGAQVMLVKNIIQGSLVNGSLGVVTGFCTAMEALRRDAFLGIADQYGTANVPPGEILQGYAQYEEHINRHPGVNFFERRQRDLIHRWEISEGVAGVLSSQKMWPVVRFCGKESEMVCVQASFDVTHAHGHIQAIRTQVPLILAWAISIHKSQGQTLDRVRVNMSRIFEKGQAYVALSRAMSIDRLEVRGFNPMKVQIHPTVLEWMRGHALIPTSIAANIDNTLALEGGDLGRDNL